MNNLIKVNSSEFTISSDFIDYQYMLMNNVETIYINFKVVLNITLNFILDKTFVNDTVKIVYLDVEYYALTSSNFNLNFLNEKLMVENVMKIQNIIPFNTKLSLICKNTAENQIFTGGILITQKIKSNWIDVESINNELYQIDFNTNNYKYIGDFTTDTFININLQISFTINWVGSNNGAQILKLNLCRVIDDSIIRSFFIRKTRGGNLIESQLVNANFLTYLKSNDDPFYLDGFYFGIDTSLCNNLEILFNDETYRVIIFNDKIR